LKQVEVALSAGLPQRGEDCGVDGAYFSGLLMGGALLTVHG